MGSSTVSSPCRPAAPASEDCGPAVARGAPQGSYVHPLQQQLDALRYPAWLLQAPELQAPQVCQCLTWVLVHMHISPLHVNRQRSMLCSVCCAELRCNARRTRRADFARNEVTAARAHVLVAFIGLFFPAERVDEVRLLKQLGDSNAYASAR